MEQLARSPHLQQLMESDLMNSLLQSSPLLQALREQNPEINSLLSDPQVTLRKP